MEQFHAAVAVGEAIAPQVHEELESLVEAELKATISQTARILKQTSLHLNRSYPVRQGREGRGERLLRTAKKLYVN